MLFWPANSCDFALYLADLIEKVMWTRQRFQRKHIPKCVVVLSLVILNCTLLEHVCSISLPCLLNQQNGNRHCFHFVTSCVFHVSEASKQLMAEECWHAVIAQQRHFWCGENLLLRQWEKDSANTTCAWWIF